MFTPGNYKLLNYYNLFHVMCKLQANVTKLFNKKLLKLYIYAG